MKRPSNKLTSACVQCQCGKCATPFHVTCGFHNGVPLYLGDWPLLIETLCPKHCRSKAVKVRYSRPQVTLNYFMNWQYILVIIQFHCVLD